MGALAAVGFLMMGVGILVVYSAYKGTDPLTAFKSAVGGSSTSSSSGGGIG